MGGKSKNTQRTKNNAKPSSSARSAELLGSATPFVGFSAHSELGLVPFAPGFASAEQMPETFDANINPQFQLLLRKMTKKDPMTKKKALQEFIDLIKETNIDDIKTILPIWPKFYHNLASDNEHNVRELAQTTLQLLVTVCKRSMAPFLKQLLPVWLASFFDNYAPAASIASNSFHETFATNANRTREVCLHCQTEIIEYATRNLTFYTPATLSMGKNLSPPETEFKYQRVVIGSLKALAFFFQHTAEGTDYNQVQAELKTLLTHPKFLSFSKHKVPSIKAAWFELMYQILQSAVLMSIIETQKSQIIATSFQYIDETDPLIAPHVWGCILTLQSNNEDWYTSINIKKALLPKLSTLLRNGFNRNAQAICPNLLPFFAKITQESLQDVNLNDFYKKFFDDLKLAITTTQEPPTSRADYAIINKTYFECLRFLLQRINNISPRPTELDTFVLLLLEENLLEPIACLLRSGDNTNVKYFFQHTAALVAFLDRQNVDSAGATLYAQLLNSFWTRIFQLVTNDLEQKDVDENFLEHVLQLVQDLYVANPSLEEHKVKFSVDVEGNENQTKSLATENNKIRNYTATAAFIQKELKQLVMQLLRICLAKAAKHKAVKYIRHVRRLTQMFSDVEFFAGLTSACSLSETLDAFVGLINDVADAESCETVICIVFEILELMEKAGRFTYIEEKLLKLPQSHVQILVLQRLLSYPLCVEPVVRTILSASDANSIIIRIAEEVVIDDNKEKFNLLHKCFFQTDTGDILINAATVDAILLAVSAPLAENELNDMVDVCGSFIAQIMPVICSNNNSSVHVQHQIFLRLFKFTMVNTPNDYISEDTLWEITTCWQDALSSQDIVIDDRMLRDCAEIVEQQTTSGKMDTSLKALDSMAEAIAKFITCSTENIADEAERCACIDKTLIAMLTSDIKTTKTIIALEEYCLYLEGLKAQVTVGVDFETDRASSIALGPIFLRTFVNLTTLMKLVCKVDNQHTKSLTEIDDEVTEDYCDPNENILKQCSEPLLKELLQCIMIASVGEGLINVVPNFDVLEYAIALSEKVKMLMRNKTNVVSSIKDRMLQLAAEQTNVTSCRALLYLIHYEQYAQFDDNATIILAEDLAENFVRQNLLKAYVNSLQYLLPKLEQKSITLQSGIMRTEPQDNWVKAAVFRCLIQNNFNFDTNEIADKNIIVSTLNFIKDITEKHNTQKQLLLYNVEIHKQPFVNVINTVEYINLLTEVLQRFPYELTIKHWDAIRIGLSSFVLSVSKSIEHYLNPKTSFFIVSVYKLFMALNSFISAEKPKSSTELLKNVIDEWENLFAREVNLVLFKSFYQLCISAAELTDQHVACYIPLLEEITPALELIDYSVVYAFCKSSTKITLDNVCNFLLKNLSSSIHNVRTSALFVIRQLTQYLVADDIELFEKKCENLDAQTHTTTNWHFLNRFEDYLARYDMPIRKYLDEFSFKLTELEVLEPIDRNEAMSYLLLWDCIIYVCAHSPVSLRSVYTNWLNENKYEENFLHFLFRAMPVDILKNHSSKAINTDIFKELAWEQFKAPDLSFHKYVCHLYSEVLRRLPAVVRRWWNTSPSRQKNFVDNLTTNYVSMQICNDELKAIASKKEKHENMQVTVHTSTREVLAVYAIDEARMELVITLAQNYPLGAVKVECGKQIGGRATSRNVGMQLTIFLTHQNGTIFDGLTLWKNNLDKKFEGVEECYVCYTVIHQDTCQLPKLTCKTCKKKFHGPCLYKWFTTSSKSTCPICRNVF